MVRDKVSYRLVKRYVKKYVNEEISKGSVLYLQDYITKMLNELCYSLSNEFESYNSEREILKLQRIKRINIFILKRTIKKFINCNFDAKYGDIGQQNRETMFSQAGVEVV